MNHNFDLIEIHTEEPARLDDFKSLVHHRGRINRDSLAHLPIWMRERLLGTHVTHFRERRLAKRATRSCQNEALYFFALAGPQALVDGVVLAIYWEQGDVVFFDCSCNQFPGGDEDFFICEGDFLAGENGFISGAQAHDADCGGDDGVRFGMRCDALDAVRAE